MRCYGESGIISRCCPKKWPITPDYGNLDPDPQVLHSFDAKREDVDTATDGITRPMSPKYIMIWYITERSIPYGTPQNPSQWINPVQWGTFSANILLSSGLVRRHFTKQVATDKWAGTVLILWQVPRHKWSGNNTKTLCLALLCCCANVDTFLS